MIGAVRMRLTAGGIVLACAWWAPAWGQDVPVESGQARQTERGGETEAAGLAEIEARAAADSGDFQAQLDLGAAYYQADRLEDAVGAFLRAVALDSTSVPAWVNLGVALVDLGRVDEAVSALERALAVHPDNPAALTNLAIAHYTSGRTETAVGLLTRAIAIDSGDQLAHFQLGIAFADTKLFEEAVREWQAVIAAGAETAAGRRALKNIERIEGIFTAERLRQRQDAIRSRR